MYQSTEPTASSTSQRFFHKRIDDLLENPIIADKDASYAKRLFLNLSTLSPHVSGPNSVKVATPLEQYVDHPRVTKHIQRAIFFHFLVRRWTCPSILPFLFEWRC